MVSHPLAQESFQCKRAHCSFAFSQLTFLKSLYYIQNKRSSLQIFNPVPVKRNILLIFSCLQGLFQHWQNSVKDALFCTCYPTSHYINSTIQQFILNEHTSFYNIDSDEVKWGKDRDSSLFFWRNYLLKEISITPSQGSLPYNAGSFTD